MAIGLLVWTDAVCSSAPYRFTIGKNVKVKVKYQMLCAEATFIVSEWCWRGAMRMLWLLIHVVGTGDHYGTG